MKPLDTVWFAKHAKQIENKSRYRYTPKLNVDLPIAQVFNSICRSPEFYLTIRAEFGKTLKEHGLIPSDWGHHNFKDKFGEYQISFDEIVQLIRPIKEYDIENIDWGAICEKSTKCLQIGWELIDELRNAGLKGSQTKTEKDNNRHPPRSDIFSNHIHYIRSAQNHIRFFENFSETVSSKLSNTPFFLLLGIAGSGKTHLFCDIATHKLKKGEKAIILFGEYFNPHKSFWENVQSQLSLEATMTEELFFSLLDELGGKSKARSIILIDALNETSDLDYWNKYIDHFTSITNRYRNVAVAVSIRSGFENRIIEAPKLTGLIRQEHQGFEFREWEAVTKFFKEFSLPLPEIPLLSREFQNPLFLLLFCKAFQERAKKGHGENFFKGHEGTTYVFENFVDAVASKIEDHFKIGHGTKTNLWETVIKPVAELMIEKNKDRVTEDELTQIILATHKQIPVKEILTQLEKNLLIVMVPNYHDGNNTSDFRFPFQKFSEHLKARYLFKKFEKNFGKSRAIDSLKKFFSSDSKVGKYLKEQWDYGLVEALCIDIPERFNGEEFYKVVPYISNDLMNEAFIQSLIWRKPTAFREGAEDVLAYLNENFSQPHSRDQVYLTLLSVASIPNHPLNAHFLFDHLNNMSMAKRDSIWSIFLHYQHGEESSVDRILEWGWSGIHKSHVKDESLELFALSVCWFFTTSNRIIRDKATKALAETFKTRPSIVVAVLQKFKEVNDPYIVERLYCAVYGATLINKEDKQDIAKIARWVYSNYFEIGNIPACILTRDYLRGIIKVALLQGLISVDENEINPPYHSKFPDNIPSLEMIKAKYNLDNYQQTEYSEIWSSIAYSNRGGLADFGNYILGSALGNWTHRRIGKKYKDIKKLIADFKLSLTRSQLIMFNRLYGLQKKKSSSKWSKKEINFIVRGKTTKELTQAISDQEQMIKNQKLRFKGQLTQRQLRFFKKYLEPYLLEGRGIFKEPLEAFDTSVGERWVFNRVIELGYEPKLHGAFDSSGRSSYSYSRHENKVERIGKKYQWIAFHEFLGLVADNFVFRKERWNSAEGKYEGPWQLYIRDIDPSCLLSPGSTNSGSIPQISLENRTYDAWQTESNVVDWLRTKEDLPSPEGLLEYKDDKGHSWVILETSFDWEQKTLPENDTYELLTRKLWYTFKSYLVKSRDVHKLEHWSSSQWFFGDWMPRSDQFHNIFLGEYPDHPAFIFHDVPYYHHSGWTDYARGDDDIPARILVTDDTYYSSWSSKDHSTEESINLALPAKNLIKQLNLEHKYNDGRFFDGHGNLIAFDPSKFGPELPSCVLFDKDHLLKFLEKKKLSFFWTLCGEKQTIGGMTMGQPFGWLEITGSYFISPKGEIKGQTRSRVKKMG